MQGMRVAAEPPFRTSLCYRVHHDTEWQSSKEMLTRSFLRQEVEVKVLGPSSLENSSSYLLSHPASICLVQKYAADPVAPAITVRMDMSTR